MLRAFSLGLKFLLELAAFAAFAYCGANVGSGVISVVLAIAAPALAIVLWGRFAAPRSDRRLATRDRIAFELSVFGLACVALLVVGARVAAAALAVLVAISTALLTRLDQWEA
jgi:hypothetical protein